MKRSIRIIVALLLVLSVLAFSSCSTAKDDLASGKVTLGEFNGTVYTNEYFGITWDIGDWLKVDDELFKQIMAAGAELADIDEKTMDLAEQKTLNMFMITKEDLQTVPTTPNIILAAEKINKLQGVIIKKEEDYIKILFDSLKKMADQIPYATSDEYEKVTLGEKEFTVATATANLGGIVLTQKFYVHKTSDYIILITGTKYDDSTDMEDMIKKAVLK
jgi:hypothetical protein